MRSNSSIVGVALALTTSTALALLSTAAMASLGGSADSVTADSSVLRGELRSTPEAQYDVHEIDTSAATVREYVTRAGQVFAVTWGGAAPPNLQQVLGDYFARLQSAATAQGSRAHRQFSIEQSDFVMRSVGRMGNFHGIAYIPSLVPEGVIVGELQ